MLGDSISDGVGATLDANRRWPDLLANRLNAQAREGLGRREYGHQRQPRAGRRRRARARSRASIATCCPPPGVKTVVIFEGVNDLGIAYGKLPTARWRERFKALSPARRSPRKR